MSNNAPDIKGKVTKTIVFNPAVLPDTDISLDDYDPEFNQEEINPIITIDVEDFDSAGPSKVFKKYNANDVGIAGSLAAGQYAVVDEKTFRLGDTLQAAGHYFTIHLTYIAGRTKNV